MFVCKKVQQNNRILNMYSQFIFTRRNIKIDYSYSITLSRLEVERVQSLSFTHVHVDTNRISVYGTQKEMQ